jgi:hypothetical protein
MTGSIFVPRLGDKYPAHIGLMLAPERIVFKKTFPDKAYTKTLVVFRLAE